MSVWAIADLHLSFGIPNKKMDIFGERWVNHAARLKEHWHALVHPDDLVLIAGDISWALKVEEAVPDLNWIHELPGTKLMIRGNHDYWWTSLAKIELIRPPSIHFLQNSAFLWNDIAIAGTRLWDNPDFRFKELIEDAPSTWTEEAAHDRDEDTKIYKRELLRLENSLKAMSKLPANKKIAMTHYPPIDTTSTRAEALELMQAYGITQCVFGHIHNAKKGMSFFGEREGIQFHLVAGDYLDFKPLRIIC